LHFTRTKRIEHLVNHFLKKSLSDLNHSNINTIQNTLNQNFSNVKTQSNNVPAIYKGNGSFNNITIPQYDQFKVQEKPFYNVVKDSLYNFFWNEQQQSFDLTNICITLLVFILLYFTVRMLLYWNETKDRYSYSRQEGDFMLYSLLYAFFVPKGKKFCYSVRYPLN
jgi:hypothetical protein